MPVLKKYRILLVDDNKKFLKAFRFLLEDTLGERIEFIEEAYNGDECLNMLEKQVMDVIFMDINMPGLDGIDTTRKACTLYRDINIIAVSFHEEMKFIKQMIEAGAKNYIIKEEINREVLERIILKN
jgi:CheY-like chemotaxis protein